MDLAALEEVSDDDLRSWIEVLEERARDGPRDNEEEGYLSLKQIYQVLDPCGLRPTISSFMAFSHPT